MYLDLNKNQPTKGYNVNKSELIDAVAESADLSKADSGRAIDAVIDAITNSLKKEEFMVLPMGEAHLWCAFLFFEVIVFT